MAEKSKLKQLKKSMRHNKYRNTWPSTLIIYDHQNNKNNNLINLKICILEKAHVIEPMHKSET